MTTTLRRQSPVDGFQVSRWFRPVVAGTLVVTAVAAAASPPGWLSAAVVVTVIAVLGIPHGAVDHLVVEAVDGPVDQGSRRRFVRNYLLAMGGVGLVWLAAPSLALMVFVALSVHHFGQSDLAYLRLPDWSQLVLQWSRGLFLVGLPLIAHVATVAPVIERLGGDDPASWSWLADFRWLWSAVLVLQHLVVGAVVAPGVRDRNVIGREAVTVATLTVLFLATDPLIGFAVYFGLWHSLAHLRVLGDLLGTQPSPMRSLARLAAPMTAVSLAAIAIVVAGATIAGRAELLVPLVFVFVSMLTMPHMVVVERLWRRQPASTG